MSLKAVHIAIWEPKGMCMYIYVTLRIQNVANKIENLIKIVYYNLFCLI